MHRTSIASNSRRRRGSTLITFSFIIAVLVPVAGLGIDTLMLSIAKERLTAAVHSAATAAERSSNPESAAERFCKANFPDGYLGTRDLQIEVTQGRVTARLQAPTYFMRIIRVQSVAVAASGQIKAAKSAAEQGNSVSGI